jgi:hypothetical protein
MTVDPDGRIASVLSLYVGDSLPQAVADVEEVVRELAEEYAADQLRQLDRSLPGGRLTVAAFRLLIRDRIAALRDRP